jgi:hypothetical protein
MGNIVLVVIWLGPYKKCVKAWNTQNSGYKIRVLHYSGVSFKGIFVVQM